MRRQKILCSLRNYFEVLLIARSRISIWISSLRAMFHSWCLIAKMVVWERSQLPFVDFKPLKLLDVCFFAVFTKGCRETAVKGSIPRRRAAAGGGDTDLERVSGSGGGDGDRQEVSVAGASDDTSGNGSFLRSAHSTVGD